MTLRLLGNMANSGLEADASTYSSVIAAAFRGGQPDIALEHLKLMASEGFRPSMTTVSLVIESLHNSGDHERAVHTYNRFLAPFAARGEDGEVDLRLCSNACAAVAIRAALQPSSDTHDLVFAISVRHAQSKAQPTSRPSLHELLQTWPARSRCRATTHARLSAAISSGE